MGPAKPPMGIRVEFHAVNAFILGSVVVILCFDLLKPVQSWCSSEAVHEVSYERNTAIQQY